MSRPSLHIATKRRFVGAALAAVALCSLGLQAPGVGAPAEALLAPAAGDVVAVAADSATVTVSGRGFGHGRGMGQWGAFGYATKPELRWTYQQILDLYYGGTTMGSVPAGRDVVGVLLKSASARNEVTLVHDQSRLVTSVAPGVQFAGLRIRFNSSGGLDVSSTTGCTAPDTAVVATAAAGTVVFDVSGGDASGADPATMIALCQSDGSRIYYRGGFRVDRGNGLVTVNNDLTLEQYLRAVVPRESPASWANTTNGIEALKAQAVAARSYTVARNGVLCDDQQCQVYGGMASRGVGAATPTMREDTRSDTAISATAGQVRLLANGAVASTEYSSSTGGWTAGGVFPVVQDLGDEVAGNANSSWTTTLTVAAIQAKWPSIGALRTMVVTDRNGVGPLGGRVLKMIIQGANGSVTVTGDEFRLAFGLKSNWFQVSSAALEFPAAAVVNGPSGAYWVAAADGNVYNYNGAPFLGSLSGIRLNAPIIGMANAGATGYWLLGRDGGVFTFNATFYGSTGGLRLAAPVVAMAARPSGDGYWFTATDGGVFSFGSARFLGSMGGQRLNKPVVGMAVTPTGNGYWLVASDGGIFSFGDAKFFGSTGAIALNKPIVAMASRPQGDGYWLVASDGGVFTFGNAPFLGSTGGQSLGGASIVGMAVTASGAGYRLVTSKGATYAYGDAVG